MSTQNSFNIVAVFGNKVERCFDIVADVDGLKEPNATIIIIRLHRSWFRGTAVERRSLAGELSLSCARSAADG